MPAYDYNIGDHSAVSLSDATIAAIRRVSDKKGRSLFAQLVPCPEDEICEGERKLATRFPVSFRDFLGQFGCGEKARIGWWIFSPAECYSFDETCGPMAGYVAVANDTCGNYLAFNPADQELSGERPIYYVCPDPFGYARIANSFDEFLARAAELHLQDEFVTELPENFVYVSSERDDLSRADHWWPFWRRGRRR